MIGKAISHYKILEKLGEGGMGVVYKAEDTKLKRTVALKFLPSELTRDSDAEKRFIHEARAAAALSHPNICTIHDIDEHGGNPFIAMEFIDGLNLKDMIEAGPLKLDDAVSIVIQAAEGLAAAHEKRIVHRDIKSANIMITEKDQATIMDFGLAKSAGRTQLTTDGTTLGTIAYMSPEQAQVHKVDHRSDIWSLGVVLYEMIAGKLPFRGDHEQAVVYSIINTEPEPLTALRTGVPMELERIVTRCLAKDNAERYQTARDLAADLQRYQRLESTQSWHARVEEAKSRRQRQRGFKTPISRWLWLLLICVPATAVLIITVIVPRFFSPVVDQPGPERIMLVVLPFVNIGNEPEQEYFADGMTEEMITILGNANYARLGVIARTSAMHYKRRDVTIEDIGQELGVGYILEGSVRRQGEQVRIAAKLINVEDQAQLWSKNFDGTMDDIFLLQSNVANQITEALAVELLQGLHLTNRTHTPDPKAYEEYLAGRFFAHKGTEESWRKAIKFYEEAVRIDPEFALAYAALSHAYSVWSGWYTVTSKIAYDKAKEAADEAIRLNPNLADAHSALAVIAAYFEWNWQKADEQFRVALDLNPNDGETYHYYGHYLSFMDRDGESIEAFRNALKFDPLSAYHRNCMGIAYLKKEEIGQAESSIKKAQELEPESPLNYYYLGFLRERQGRLEEAILSWQKAVQYSNRLPTFLAALGYGYGKSGQTDKAHEILEELEWKSRDGHIAAMDISKVYAGLGDSDRAFALLEEAYTNRESWILGLKLDPGFDTIRDDPRFLNLLSRIGVEP
jgi:TolB-like protein/Tfp pilus assembly protein PilF/predicted Ser/Thr protein kinase